MSLSDTWNLLQQFCPVWPGTTRPPEARDATYDALALLYAQGATHMDSFVREARMAKKQTKLEKAMREVHTNEPSTVARAKVSGAKKEAMLRAIAFSKVRAEGGPVPKPKKRGKQ